MLAGLLLMGIFCFVCCGFSTWWLFQQQGALAERTLTNTYIPEIENSRLNPEDKQLILVQLENFGEQLRGRQLENWQAAGVMQRLVRLPVLEWGDLQAVQQRLEENADDHAEALKHVSRLFRAVELDQITAVDMEGILEPVLRDDATPEQRRTLVDPIPIDAALDVAERARIAADRSKVPDQAFDEIQLSKVIRRQIDAGLTQGGM
jgi:hypothetical protein